ncbi:MAG: Na+/H+ antiporter subunit D, partial [Rhodospirillales bacterium]|nr:Na+/H+ antiporter subunit D [Rhodospirillales bacterium]
MTISSFPPGLLLIIGGLLLPFVTANVRTTLILGLPLIVLWGIWQIGDGVQLSLLFLDYQLA